jgi:hypothetical protein
MKNSLNTIIFGTLKLKATMKRFKITSILFVLLSVLSISCDTEPVDPVLNENGNGNENPGSGSAVFKVDFNGETYVATNTLATVGNGLISIGGLKGSNGQAVSIVIEGTTTGTYSGGDVALMDYNPGNSEYSYSNLFVEGADAGSVTISSIDTANKTISGTFHFLGKWTDDEANIPSITFTNGTFTNIPYTGGIATPDEFFKATVDGTPFSYAGSDLAVVVAEGTPTLITINAINANHKFNISFPDTITQGTYTFQVGASVTARARYTDAQDNNYNITGGTLTITSNANGWVAGSFSFPVMAADGTTVLHTVSAGTFNVEWDF